jgi:hypothetical protein
VARMHTHSCQPYYTITMISDMTSQRLPALAETATFKNGHITSP